MNSKEIVDYLKSEASEKYKENVIKMGIPEKFCIGVSTSTLRKFAKSWTNLMNWPLNYGIPITMRLVCLQC